MIRIKFLIKFRRIGNNIGTRRIRLAREQLTTIGTAL